MSPGKVYPYNPDANRPSISCPDGCAGDCQEIESKPQGDCLNVYDYTQKCEKSYKIKTYPKHKKTCDTGNVPKLSCNGCEPNPKKDWIDYHLLDNFNFGLRFDECRSDSVENALIPGFLINYSMPQTSPRGLGYKVGKPFRVIGSEGEWQKYAKKRGYLITLYIKNCKTGEEQVCHQWKDGVTDTAIIDLDASKLFNTCNLIKKHTDPLEEHVYVRQDNSYSVPLLPIVYDEDCQLKAVLDSELVGLSLLDRLRGCTGERLWITDVNTGETNFQPENLDECINVSIDGATVRADGVVNSSKGGAGKRGQNFILTSHTYANPDQFGDADGTPSNPLTVLPGTTEVCIDGTTVRANGVAGTTLGGNCEVVPDSKLTSHTYGNVEQFGDTDGTPDNRLFVNKGTVGVYTRGYINGDGATDDRIFLEECPGLKPVVMDYSNVQNDYVRSVHRNMQTQASYNFLQDERGVPWEAGEGGTFGQPTPWLTATATFPLDVDEFDFKVPEEAFCSDYKWLVLVTLEDRSAFNVASEKVAIKSSIVFEESDISSGNIAVIRGGNPAAANVTERQACYVEDFVPRQSDNDYGDSQGICLHATDLLAIKPGRQYTITIANERGFPNNSSYSSISTPLTGNNVPQEFWFGQLRINFVFLGKVKYR